MIVAVVAILLTLLVSRLWLHNEPVERLELEIPTDATFQYGRFVEYEDETGSGAVWYMSPVSPESGSTLINLIQRSERQEDSRWKVQFDWPPIRREDKWIGITATFSAAATPIELDFEDESTFMTADGLFTVPEENRAELRTLLDALDAECQASFEQERNEAANQSEQADH
jgi:hypothetical protein